jgi:hypothetical protein
MFPFYPRLALSSLLIHIFYPFFSLHNFLTPSPHFHLCTVLFSPLSHFLPFYSLISSRPYSLPFLPSFLKYTPPLVPHLPTSINFFFHPLLFFISPPPISSIQSFIFYYSPLFKAPSSSLFHIFYRFLSSSVLFHILNLFFSTILSSNQFSFIIGYLPCILPFFP